MAHRSELPVFFDPTGRRWIKTKVFVLIITLAFFAGVFYFLPLVLRGETATTARSSMGGRAADFGTITHRYADNLLQHIIHETSGRNIPILGKGPLVRVVRIDNRGTEMQLDDPFTGKTLRTLTESEKNIVYKYPYVVERYGTTNTRRIALTFDDGPDAVYSPKILDILHKEGAQSTFFVTGANVVKHSDIAKRMVREGHSIGNHSFSHPHFEFINEFRSFQEINQTNRVVRTVTGHDTPFYRPPYIGSTNQELRGNIKSILEGQRQGYVMVSYQFDPQDWNIKNGKLPPLPQFDGGDVVVLLHDAGGDRHGTIKYLQRVIATAKEHGYTFVNIDQLYRSSGLETQKVQSSVGDKASYVFFSALLVWPHVMVKILFALTAFLVSFSVGVNVVLSVLQNRRVTCRQRVKKYRPFVSVIVPAYNEENVLKKTVRSVLQSYYKNLEVIIIDDGSQDNTYKVGKLLERRSKRVICLTKRNGGKSSAINEGLQHASGEIVICIDADTVFPPVTIGRLVRHFKDPTVGAVAGIVKVGNIKNMLTRWQALEYTISAFLDRNAQAYVNSIMIVPGACGAWRKRAVLDVKGYSSMTFAEDCDLTLAIHKAGYKVLQDSSAYAYTEAPQHIKALAKQRFRWLFGNIQALWKHRDILLRSQYGWLGLFVMPYTLLTIVLSIIFIPFLLILAAHNIASGNYHILVMFVCITLSIQFIVACIAVALAKERKALLYAFPLTRFVYGPIKTFLLFRSFVVILRGATIAWNKLQRTNTVEFRGKV